MRISVTGGAEIIHGSPADRYTLDHIHTYIPKISELLGSALSRTIREDIVESVMCIVRTESNTSS